jgi:glycosyltransferase involved in cell wall biosynthesis
MKPKIAVIRGAFLNRYEMQFYEPLTAEFDITAFGSLKPFHDRFAFHTVKLFSPMDLPDFPGKMPVLNRLFTDAHYLFGLEEKLRGFDIVHSAETYYRFTQQALNAKKQGYTGKVIATVLENIPFNNEGIWGRRAYKSRAREQLDHLIALTDKTRQALIREGADPTKISVINHYIDTKRFYPVKSQQNLISSDVFDITILYCGRLEEYKGVLDILEAARDLKSDPELARYQVRYLFVGNGSLKNKLQSLGKDYGLNDNLIFSEADYADMPKIYHRAQIFLAPSRPTISWEEQYNTALLEAQSSGLPIITTRSGGIPENIGDAGIIVEPGDVTALVRALRDFIKNPKVRLKYAQKARLRAVSQHDISIGSGKLAALYRKLLT